MKARGRRRGRRAGERRKKRIFFQAKSRATFLGHPAQSLTLHSGARPHGIKLLTLRLMPSPPPPTPPTSHPLPSQRWLKLIDSGRDNRKRPLSVTIFVHIWFSLCITNPFVCFSFLFNKRAAPPETTPDGPTSPTPCNPKCCEQRRETFPGLWELSTALWWRCWCWWWWWGVKLEMIKADLLILRRAGLKTLGKHASA